MIEIRVEDPNVPEVLELLDASDALMDSLYPSESNHLIDVHALRQPNVTFLVARSDGMALGCAAVVDAARDWSEIKRMFVSPAARGKGVGRLLLRQLQSIARQQGKSFLRLETGIKQPEALALYRSHGFKEIAAFGNYRPDPLSLFMEMALES